MLCRTYRVGVIGDLGAAVGAENAMGGLYNDWHQRCPSSIPMYVQYLPRVAVRQVLGEWAGNSPKVRQSDIIFCEL